MLPDVVGSILRSYKPMSNNHSPQIKYKQPEVSQSEIISPEEVVYSKPKINNSDYRVTKGMTRYAMLPTINQLLPSSQSLEPIRSRNNYASQLRSKVVS